MTATATRDRAERRPASARARNSPRNRNAPRSRSDIVPSWSPDLLLSTGTPLPIAVRASLENGFGRDLADVRVHDDAGAAQLADAAGAAAFVLGAHIFFAAGRYDPHSAPGRRLLAHEVAHVVQTRGGAVAESGEVTGCREAEADQLAERALEHGALEDGALENGAVENGAVAQGERRGAADPPHRQIAAPIATVPDVQLPALRYTDAVSRGTTGTVHVLELVVRMIARSLRTDPDDRSGRIRAQLARLTPEVRENVLSRAQASMPASDFARLEAILEHSDPGGAALSTPAVGADPDDVAASEPTATGSAEHPSPSDPPQMEGAGAHTHADGTTHAHADSAAHGHEHPHNQPTGLLGRIAAALFGASPLFSALAARAGSPPGTAAAVAQSGPAPAGATAAPALAAAAARAAPAAGAGAAPQTAGAEEAGPVSAEDEQQAEGRPAPVHGPAPGPAPAVPTAGAQPGAAPESPAAPRIADPQAAVSEVAAAGAGGSPTGPAGAAASTGTEGAGGTAQTQSSAGGAPEAAPSPERQRLADEDRTVLATHEHAAEADLGDPSDEPASAGEASAEPATAPDPGEFPAATGAGESAETAPGEPIDSPASPPVAEASVDASSEADAGAGMGGAESAGAGIEAADGGAAQMAPAEVDVGPEGGGPEAPSPDGAGPEADGAGPDAAGPEGAGPDAAGPEGAAAGAPGGLAACMGGAAGERQPPAPEADAPSAGCSAGGGGAASAGPPPAAVPDVSGATPDTALATVGALPATDLQQAIPQVGAAVTADVGAQRAAMPPATMDRPSGASAALDVTAPIPQRPTTPYTGPGQPDRVNSPAGQPTPQPDLQPTPSPAAQQVAVATPRVGGEQQLTEAEAARVTESIDSVPTTDPQLAVDAGDPGAVALESDADPALVGRQRESLGTQISTVATQGARDAGAPLGEANIRPHVPPATLTAAASDGACPGLSAGGRSAATGGSRHPAVAINAIVAERSRGDIQAGVASAGTGFAAARDKRDADTAAARTESDTQMNDAVQHSNTDQVTLRRDAITRSSALRGEWTQAQHTAVDTAVGTSDTAARTGTAEVVRAKREHEATARGHIDGGNRQIRDVREGAERQAREKKAAARREKHGILGWIGSKIASFFEGLKAAITGFFDAARNLVRRAIDGAKRLAHAAIELGRRAVVGAIRLAGDAIIAAGDVVLAAFPATRARFREKVNEVVDTATRKVNEAADALERGIQRLLDALGRALDCALQYLQAGYLAAVDLLASVVKAALDAAQQFLDTLADWVAVIADIAGDPIGWLRALGRSAIDGARNCLFGALKRSIKQWFNDKVEEVVGVGRLILNVLLRGCLSFADIARMAWDGIKAALPGIVTQLIIEKLVALIIPAGAALSLLIDGLKAAWGAAGRILAAFQKFIAFLKAVRTGGGPGAFADLVGAAAVAAIDFISNFLIDRLKGAGKGVGGSLRSMAQRIGRTLGRAGRAIGRGVRAVGRGVMRGVRAGAGLVRRGAAAVVRGGRRIVSGAIGAARRVGAMLPRGVVRAASRVAHAVDPRRLARAIARSRVGQAVGRGANRARDWAAAQRDRLRARYEAWRERRRQRHAQSADERLAGAAAQIRPGLESMLRRGVSGAWLWAKLRYWQYRYRLSSLVAHGGDSVSFEAHVNPWEVVGQGVRPAGAVLRQLVERVAGRLERHPDVVAGGDLIAERAASTGHIEAEPELMGPLGLHSALSRQRMQQGRNTGRTVMFGGHPVETRRFGAYDSREGIVNRLGAYPDIVAQLRRDMPGQSDAQITAAMHQLAIGGRSGASQPASLARAAYLVYNFESRRNPRNLVSAAMTVELAERNRGSIGDLPQAPVGAGRAARFLADPLDVQRARVRNTGPSDSRGLASAHRKSRDELRPSIARLQRDTIRQAARWLDVKMAAEGLEYFTDPGHAEQWVLDQMLAHYGVLVHAHAALASTGGPGAT